MIARLFSVFCIVKFNDLLHGNSMSLNKCYILHVDTDPYLTLLDVIYFGQISYQWRVMAKILGDP